MPTVRRPPAPICDEFSYPNGAQLQLREDGGATVFRCPCDDGKFRRVVILPQPKSLRQKWGTLSAKEQGLRAFIQMRSGSVAGAEVGPLLSEAGPPSRVSTVQGRVYLDSPDGPLFIAKRRGA